MSNVMPENLCAQGWLASPLTSLIVSLLGVIVGAVVAWFVSRHFYKAGGDELKREAALLHKSTNALFAFLQQHPGAQIEAKRDPQGHIVGIVVTSTGHASGSWKVNGVSE